MSRKKSRKASQHNIQDTQVENSKRDDVQPTSDRQQTSINANAVGASAFPAEVAAQYLLTEFEMLHNRAQQQEQAITNKINFYFAITTAIVGGFFLASDNQNLSAYLLPTLWIALLFLALLGWSTFRQVLDLHAGFVFYYRRAGRIRKWFLDHQPSLEPYIPFVVTDDSPLFYSPHIWLHGVESVFLLVNSAIIAILGGLTLWIVNQWSFHGNLIPTAWWSVIVSVVSGVCLFVIVWTIQVFYTRRFQQSRQRSEHERGKVHFPHPMMSR